MSAPECPMCGRPVQGRRVYWDYNGYSLYLCPPCAGQPLDRREQALKGRLRELDRARREAAAAAARQDEAARAARRRTDVPAEQLEERVLHAFLDLVNERKAAGKTELVVTVANLATWLQERTTLPVTPRQVQHLVLALRDGGIITIGGAGVGLPNRYDTREAEMGIDAFWNQVDAFLVVYRLPNRLSLLDT